VITVSMATVIDTPRDRVWRALTCPREVLGWDDRVLAFGGSANDDASVAPETETRWRFRLGSVPVDARAVAIEVIPERRLRSDISLGLFRFEATYTLETEEDGSYRTRVSLRLATSNAVPLVGGELDRFDVRRLASELIVDTLGPLQRWCESRSQSRPQPGAAHNAERATEPARIRCGAPPAPSGRGPRSVDA
jgi:uncharacterized protein YndB with AHSA1/START domain